MKFEISGFYSSRGLFKARGPGKVIHPPSRTSYKGGEPKFALLIERLENAYS